MGPGWLACVTSTHPHLGSLSVVVVIVDQSLNNTQKRCQVSPSVLQYMRNLQSPSKIVTNAIGLSATSEVREVLTHSNMESSSCRCLAAYTRTRLEKKIMSTKPGQKSLCRFSSRSDEIVEHIFRAEMTTACRACRCCI